MVCVACLCLSSDAALAVPIAGMVFMLLPFAGVLSDLIGRKPLWRFSLIELTGNLGSRGGSPMATGLDRRALLGHMLDVMKPV